ncbi:integrator complex subunit 13-like [Tubulanus polymorphus]|uniref:integrator complex subunit 13-like n=1 Tax=Tubulanus polymorphus TaxID=672921 RepID=UPI003DA2E6A3
MYPHSHKTVIVLDHDPHLLTSSKQSTEFDVLQKGRAPGIIPLAPVTKTLWTANVEAAIEFARIIWDIYPCDKLIQFIVSDSKSSSLNSWAPNEQNLQQVLLNLAQVGPPSKSAKRHEDNILIGLNQAVQCLSEPSISQHKLRTSMTEIASEVLNRGRIICLSPIKSDAYARKLCDSMMNFIHQQNKLAANTDNLMPIHHCEFHLIHVTPFGTESAVSSRGQLELSTCLSSEVHVSQSGKYIAAKMLQLAQKHFSLASTTVTGIPMKEEQNASSSANYDVELFHSMDAHNDMIKTGMADYLRTLTQGGSAEGGAMIARDGFNPETVTLKWCTPKSNTAELHHCIGAYRVTPVDVNGRPSLCLTNFLLNGRAVMLEQPRKSGLKVMSHMLASHGGEIYIHVLSTSRSILEDPPSISEGCGGRVTDYRINHFGEYMRDNRLAPATDVNEQEESPLNRAKGQLERTTRMWPMTISETIIFNMISHLDPLPSFITKERLEDDDVIECKKAIYHLVGTESRNEALPVATVGARGKGPKRDEQYRQMWSELEQLIRSHAESSDGHQQVLECLLECKKPDEIKLGSKKAHHDKQTIKDEKMDTTSVSWKEVDRYGKALEKDKQDQNEVAKVKEEPPPKKFKKSFTSIGKIGSQSLLSIWKNKMNTLHSQRHAEFAGRAESLTNQAQLYIHLNEDSGDIKLK